MSRVVISMYTCFLALACLLAWIPAAPAAAAEDDLSSLRDPHAYSDGYTLSSGPHSLPGSRQLHLADDMNFGGIQSDRLEHLIVSGADTTVFDGYAWYGDSYDKAVLKVAAELEGDSLEQLDTELLWSQAVRPFWDLRLGMRHQSGNRPDRSWLVAGVQGLAPYWFEINATAYLSDGGHGALKLEAEYDLRLTQRLILQPRITIDFYNQSDPEAGVGDGLSSASAGLRLRYEFNRRFAPYVGYLYTGDFGETADLLGPDVDSRESLLIAGVKFWF